MRPVPIVSPVIACCVLTAACGTTEVANAPPAIVEECRREVAAITEAVREVPPSDQAPPADAGPTDEILDEARAARREARQEGLAAWPEEVLLYRCLTSRGVMLTDEQAQELARWEARTAPAEDEPRSE